MQKFEIDRRDNLSYEEFAEKYLYANKPVIVTDMIRQWKALSRWTPEFFQREFVGWLLEPWTRIRSTQAGDLES